jgi:hypothetical protein
MVVTAIIFFMTVLLLSRLGKDYRTVSVLDERTRPERGYLSGRLCCVAGSSNGAAPLFGPGADMLLTAVP